MTCTSTGVKIRFLVRLPVIAFFGHWQALPKQGAYTGAFDLAGQDFGPVGTPAVPGRCAAIFNP